MCMFPEEYIASGRDTEADQNLRETEWVVKSQKSPFTKRMNGVFEDRCVAVHGKYLRHEKVVPDGAVTNI